MPANNMAATMAAMKNRIRGFLFTSPSNFPAPESAFNTLRVAARLAPFPPQKRDTRQAASLLEIRNASYNAKRFKNEK
jgi:hypothetical protein